MKWTKKSRTLVLWLTTEKAQCCCFNINWRSYQFRQRTQHSRCRPIYHYARQLFFPLPSALSHVEQENTFESTPLLGYSTVFRTSLNAEFPILRLHRSGSPPQRNYLEVAVLASWKLNSKASWKFPPSIATLYSQKSRSSRIKTVARDKSNKDWSRPSNTVTCPHWGDNKSNTAICIVSHNSEWSRTDLWLVTQLADVSLNLNKNWHQLHLLL